MSSTLRKVLIGSIASLTIGIAALSMSAPASAAFRHGGGGFGGFHHGFGGGFHHGFGGRGFGLGLGLGALGAYDYGYGADYPYYGDYGYGYDPNSGCTSYRPVYDRYGNYLGRSLVDTCQ